MGDIKNMADDVFESFEGDQPSFPDKGEVRQLFSLVDTTIAETNANIAAVEAGNGAGFLTYVTLAAMNADTTQADKVTAQNLEDDNIYRWNDAGNVWVLIGPNPNARLTALETSVPLLEGSAYSSARTVMNVDLMASLSTDVFATAIDNSFIRNVDGTLGSAAGNKATGFIEVTANTAITRFGTTINSGATAPFAFYDADFNYLGFEYSAMVEGAQIYEISTALATYPTTRYVRLTAATGTSQAYVYDKRLIYWQKDALFSRIGLPEDVAGALTGKYILKTTGAITTGSSMRLSVPIKVTADSWICHGGGLISPLDSSQCSIAFFDDADAFLGYFNPVARWQPVKVRDTGFVTATKIYVSMPVTDVGAVHVLTPGEGRYNNLDLLIAGEIVDYFSAPFLVGGRLSSTGGITQPTHEFYRTTEYISVSAGQKFKYTGKSVTTTAPTISMYDADKLHLGALLTAATTGQVYADEEVTIPAGTLFVRASVNTEFPPYSFKSVRPAQALQEAQAAGTVISLPPDAAYGRLGEPIYLYAEGIAPAADLAFAPEPGEFSTFQGRDKCLIVKSNNTDPANVTVRATVGTNIVDISEFPIRIVDEATIVSPAVPRTVVFIGDSTTSQLTNDPTAIDGDGTYVNEVGRQLTGTGTPGLPFPSTGVELADGTEWGPVVAGDIRPALGLTNIHIRGTRGAGVLGHEGRGGWHASNYLERNDEMTMHISAPFVAGNSITGTLSLRGVNQTVGPVAFTTDSATTLAALASAIQTKMLLYGTGPTATVSDADDVLIKPRFSISFNNFVVTGGASQPDITFGDGKINAFWDPTLTPWGPVGTTWQFSMKYYIENNGWDIATLPASGVDATGSNLTVFILLGLNDYGNNTDPGVSAGNMQSLAQQILLEYPDADVVFLGWWAPPKSIFKANTGSVQRFYSQTEGFNFGTRAFGSAFRAVAQDIANCEYLQVSHQMDPDYCFSKAEMPPNRVANDSTLEIVGAGDMVHMRRRGYVQLAWIIVDWFLWKYCRP